VLQTVESLSRWFLKIQRNLPWRMTSDPYKIWISEVMLQQTQVTTVIPYYERFIRAFPDIKSLALAEEESVLQLWAGLGYYSRARNLHRGAQTLMKRFPFQFPQTRRELLEIPGIGPYTAGAILSIAFDLKEPLVDGNVERVLSRYFAFKHPIDSSHAKNFFWQKAQEWVLMSRSPRVFNQALMELGSLICTKSHPKCSLCPIQDSCEALKQNLTNDLPKKTKKPKPKEIHQIKFIFEKSGKFWIKKNTEGEWWSGLWDFPSIELPATTSSPQQIAKLIEQYTPTSWKELPHQKHTVTHHRLFVVPIHIKVTRAPSIEGQWTPLHQIKELPVSALVKRIINHNF